MSAPMDWMQRLFQGIGGQQQPPDMSNPYGVDMAIQQAMQQQQRAQAMQMPQVGAGRGSFLAGLAQMLGGRALEARSGETLKEALSKRFEIDNARRTAEAEQKRIEEQRKFDREIEKAKRIAEEEAAAKARHRAPDPFASVLQNLSPQEIERAGRIKYGLEARPGSSPVININPSQRNENAFQEALGKSDADLYSQGRAQAIAAQQAMNSINSLDSILSTTKTGKAQEVYGQLAQWVGAPEGADYQATQALVNDRVFELINALKGPATDKDAERAMAQIPSMGTDPRARKVVFDYLRKKADTQVRMFNEMDQYANQRGSLQGFKPSVGQFDLNTAPLGDMRAGPGQEEQGPMPGARRAPDGKWYVNQNGQWFEVTP